MNWKILPKTKPFRQVIYGRARLNPGKIRYSVGWINRFKNRNTPFADFWFPDMIDK